MNCSKCYSYIKTKGGESTSLLSALFIAVIPKCSICVMAYSSAIAMCGGNTLYMEHNNWASYIPLILSLLILFFILKKKNGIKTNIALTIGLFGFGLILGAHQTWIGDSFYNIGNILMFLAIWVNTSFFSMVVQIRNYFTRKLAWLK